MFYFFGRGWRGTPRRRRQGTGEGYTLYISPRTEPTHKLHPAATYYTPPAMGLDWSAPPGRADFPPSVLPFTVWNKHDLQMMKRRHAASLGGIYALQPKHFAKLLGADRRTCDPIFDGILDTDANGLVDAFEAMCAFALLCSATLVEKVDFMHSLFDFRLEGDLSLPEVTILVRTALIACAKLDFRVQVPSTEAIEGLCRMAFNEAQLDDESLLARHLFESFVFRDAQMTAFLQLWSGSISQVSVSAGMLWEDPDFPADQSALSLVAGIVPPGVPPAGTVRWLRPTEVAKGEAVLFVGDMPGEGPIVAGQLADQWLLSAIGILTGRPHLLRSLFLPTGQEAVGRYGVRLFKEANWTNFYVDTRIPCSASGDPLFCRGEERHELWGFILEKAFAKAHGCYQNLMHGETCEALRDMTGGVVEKLQWQLVEAGAPASSHGATSAPAQKTSQQERRSSPAAAAVTPVRGGREVAGVKDLTVTGGRAPASCIRATGWGMSAGTPPPSGWIFENIRGKISDGQVVGCSRQAWARCPWGDTGSGDGDGHIGADEGSVFPPSNRVMRGLCSGVSYCVLEVFEKGDVRLIRLRDPWAARQRGAEPGEYAGDWGPSSPQWSARPVIASELLPRTFRGMFWMAVDAFLEVFNTLYAVDLTGGRAEISIEEREKTKRRMLQQKQKDGGSTSDSAVGASVNGSREDRCQGSWEGEGCGGRFTAGKGWLQGTQAFLEIKARDTGRSGGIGSSSAVTAVTAPSSGVPKGRAENGEDKAQVLITVTQEDSRYHHRDYTARRERQRSIGFLVHNHRWSTESKRQIPKLTKILEKETRYVTRPFAPTRDVSCRLALPPGQYAIVATSLEAGMPGRFWVHVKADRNFTLQPSLQETPPGSHAGDCELHLEEAGMTVEVAYNEVEEDAEGNAMTADAACLGNLLSSAQALAARKAALEHHRRVLVLQRQSQDHQQRKQQGEGETA